MDESINKYIKELRESKGLNITDLAREIGVSRPFVSTFESGKSKMSDDKTEKIIKVLSSDSEEYIVHCKNIHDKFGITLKNTEGKYGVQSYDFRNINRMAMNFTYGNKKLTHSDIALIKHLAKTLADKN